MQHVWHSLTVKRIYAVKCLPPLPQQISKQIDRLVWFFLLAIKQSARVLKTRQAEVIHVLLCCSLMSTSWSQPIHNAYWKACRICPSPGLNSSLPQHGSSVLKHQPRGLEAKLWMVLSDSRIYTLAIPSAKDVLPSQCFKAGFSSPFRSQLQLHLAFHGLFHPSPQSFVFSMVLRRVVFVVVVVV